MAKQESLEAINEAPTVNSKVIVTWCMGVNEEDLDAIPADVLSISSPQDIDSVMSAVRKSASIQHNPVIELLPTQGIKLTPKHYVYIR